MTLQPWSRRQWLAAAALPWLASCAHRHPGDDPHTSLAGESANAHVNDSAWARACRLPPGASAWGHKTFPQRHPVRYRTVDDWMGRPALHAAGVKANSLIRSAIVPAMQTRLRCRFSWYADTLNLEADVADPYRNDACLRWTVSFSGDRSPFTGRDHALSELSALLTGEPLPHATMMYIWDPRYPVGTVIPYLNSRRIRYLVIQSGPDGLHHWNDHERDVMADFQQVFQEPPAPIEGVAAFTNSNNTGHSADGWYGPLTFLA